MSWTLLILLVLALGVALCAAWLRRRELEHMREHVDERRRATRAGSAKAQLQHPVIDLSRCLGCGKCVTACPEDGVLALVHGQAAVVNGARCTGVAACERECPVGAIQVTLTELDERRDVPALTESLEAVGTPGLFLAGEVTAHALIKTAIEHGTAVAAEVARRVQSAAANGTRAPLPSSAAPQAQRAAVGATSATASRAGGAPRARSASSATEEPIATAVEFAPWLEGAVQEGVPHDAELHDLVVVGAGPAGLACSLEARRHGLAFVTLDQDESLGGTVAKYPRRKLVLTQPVALPLHGKLTRTTYTKEELIDLWNGVAREHSLPIRHGEVLQSVERAPDGTFTVRTQTGAYRARHVCLSIGRRGTPAELGVPGERLSKVAYSLVDAQSYQGRRVLVVGGGDSAVETAVALAEQPGNDVTLSYRGTSFFRARVRNEQRLLALLAEGRLRVLYSSHVRAIHADRVEIDVLEGGVERRYELPNDDVFVLAGGVPPFPLLERAGVSFDPAQRPKQAAIEEQGPGLVRALAIGFGLALAALAWALVNADYYALPMEARPEHDDHLWLRPGLGLGLAFGIASLGLVVVNLLYLARRANWWKFGFGSLQGWMTSHVATGVLALLAATLHGGMAPRDTLGGHSLWAMVVLFASGAIGRYLYAWVPRAANGRELELGELELRLERLGAEYDGSQREFVDRVRAEVATHIERNRWSAGFLGRVMALVRGRRALNRSLATLATDARRQGVPAEHVERTLAIAREAWRLSTFVAHYEDLRALVNSWRYVHRWVALLLVILVAFHVFNALSYGELLFTGGLR
ncbi:MAG: NAD(P)-binding domain-containing protein [Planctomycetes bacterium]|nr:NAD(P)-binding domain-containing protein [Planctomycetota bacterium]